MQTDLFCVPFSDASRLDVIVPGVLSITIEVIGISFGLTRLDTVRIADARLLGERICSKRENLAFRCIRAFECDSLVGQIYRCEDLYLKERTAIHKIMV